jgi:hypothetical protein
MRLVRSLLRIFSRKAAPRLVEPPAPSPRRFRRVKCSFFSTEPPRASRERPMTPAEWDSYLAQIRADYCLPKPPPKNP